MATIDIHDLSGKKVGTLELADEIFGAINEDLLYEAVTHYRAAQRAGTHATKNKKLVSGAGKKLWKQKGTGRARVGSIRSPLWRHGGTVHGPQPRSALAAKLSDGKLIVVNAFDVKEAKTQAFRESLDSLKVDKGALLVEVANHGNRNLHLSSRNLDGIELVSSSEVHPYHLLRYDRAIFSQPAIEKLQVSLKNLSGKREHKAGEGEGGKKAQKKATRSPRTRTKKAAEVA